MKKYKSWFVINVFCLLMVALVTGIYCINNPILNNDGNMGHTIGKNVSISGVANNLNIGGSQSTTFEKNMKIEQGDSETDYTFVFDPFSFVSTSQDIEFALDLANLDDSKDILVTISLEESLPAGVTVSLNSTYVTLPYEGILAKSGEVSLKFGFSSNSIATISNFKLNINFKHVSSLNNAYLAKNWKDVVYATFGANASNTTQIDFVNDLSAYKTSDFVGFNTTTGLATSANIGALNYNDSDAMTESSSTVSDIKTYAIKTTENTEDTYKLVAYTPSKLYANRTLAEFLKDYTKLKTVTFNNFDTTNCFYYHAMFANCSSLTNLDVSGFNTRLADDMSSMFYGCSLLNSLNLSNFNTMLTQDMHGMFAYCSSLQSLNISSFNTSLVKNMNAMFIGCEELTELNLSNFDTSNVTDMYGMFGQCKKLNNLNISSFNTSKVENMAHMFNRNENLSSLDLSSFNTEKVKSMMAMFAFCYNLTNLDLSNFTTSSVEDMGGMFVNCDSLTTLNISNFDMTNVTSCVSMLEFGTSNAIQTLRTPKNAPEEISITSANTLYWENEQAPVVFAGLNESRTYTYVAPNSTSFPTDWKTQLTNTSGEMTINSVSTPVAYADITSISFNYYAPSGYTQIGKLNSGVKVYKNNNLETDLLFVWGVNIKAPSTSSFLFSNLSNVKTINCANFNTTSVTTMQGMFQDCNLLQNVDMSKFNTEKVTNMNAMFAGCTNLKSADLSSFKTPLVQNMGGMFNGCNNLEAVTFPTFSNDVLVDTNWMFAHCYNLSSLDLSKFNTSKVVDMNRMFNECTGLQTLNVSGFNTSSATNMEAMFYNCNNLQTLDLSVFNTGSVQNMAVMFKNCSSLNSLNVSSFNTSNVTTMAEMFQNCSSLTQLNVSSFNTAKVTTMNAMFAQCTNLQSIDLSSFETPLVENMGGMFNDCSGIKNINFGKFINTNLKTMGWMFGRCSSLETLDMSEFYTGSVTDMGFLFYLCSSLKVLDVSNFDLTNVTAYSYIWDFNSSPEVIYTPRITTDAINIVKNNTLYDLETGSTLTTMPGSLTSSKTIVSTAPVAFASDWMSKIQSTSYMSTTINPNSITSIAFEKTAPSGYSYRGAFSSVSVYVNGNQVAFVSSSAIKAPESCTNLFAEMSNLQSISFNNFYTSTAIYMDGMFKNNPNLLSINFPMNFKVNNVDAMQYMFHGCSKLQSLDLKYFHTWNVTNTLRAMFWNCSSLTTLDVSSFKTKRVISMWDMFSACSGLERLDLSSFDTSSLTDVKYMFNGCTSLKYLDLSSFDMSKVNEYENMLNFGTNNYIQTLKTPKSTLYSLSITTGSTLYYNGSVVSSIPNSITASRTYTNVV